MGADPDRRSMYDCIAYFGIKSLTVISYIAVPLVAIHGTVAMIMAIKQGDGTIVDQFAKSSGSLSVIGGAGLAIGSFVSGGTATPNFTRFAKNGKQGTIATVVAFFIGNSLMFSLELSLISLLAEMIFLKL